MHPLDLLPLREGRFRNKAAIHHIRLWRKANNLWKLCYPNWYW